jgi:predicted permease
MSWFENICRRSIYRDLSEELRQHLDEMTEELMRNEGLSRGEAEQAARRSFGNVTLLEERSREVWQWPTLESLCADAKHAVRQLAKSPGITFIAILTLALGIGANTAIFTLTWNIILKTLPVPHPERLVEYEMRDGDHMLGLSGPEYLSLRRRQQSCIDLLAWGTSEAVSIRQGTQSVQQRVQFLTGNTFRVLEMRPALGSFFSEDETGNRGYPVLLSYDEWQRRFHGDVSALRQTLFVDNHPVTIIGVMPRAFDGLTANAHPSLYLPFGFSDVFYDKDYRTSSSHFAHYVLGRLKPGVSLTRARAELSALEPSIRKDADPSGIYLGQFFRSFRLTLRDGRSGVSYLKMTYESPLLVLELLVCFLLLLCGLNTALVMLARVSGRQQEYALRAALGALRGRLVRQVLVETLLLAIPGLAGGILLGWLGAHSLAAMLGSDRGVPQDVHIHPNAIIVGVNVAATLLVALGAGLVPAIRAAGVAPALDLKSTDRSVASKQLGGWVIALQVAVSLCLVSTAFLLGGTLVRLLSESSGFKFDGAATATIDVESLKLKQAQNAAIFSQLNDALQTKPGVTQVGFTRLLPLSVHYMVSRMFSIDRHHVIHSDHSMFYTTVSPAYFAAVGTRIVSGESTAAAPGTAGNCVLSRSLARFFFPDENPIGGIVYQAASDNKPDGTVLDPKESCRVVGIAEDAKYISLRQPAPSLLYGIFRPEAQTDAETEVVVRAGSDALALAAIRQAIAETIPSNAVVTTRTFSQRVHEDLSRERMLVGLSSAFAVLALLLTALGLYGLVTRSVTLRTREIGIRVALGAQRRSILVALGKRTLLAIVIGVLAGTAIAVLMSKAIRRLLDMYAGAGPERYLLAVGLILLVALLAMIEPARRAASVDPMQALRSE